MSRTDAFKEVLRCKKITNGKKNLVIKGGTSIPAALVRRLSDHGHPVLADSRHANGIDALPGVSQPHFDATNANSTLAKLMETLSELV